MFTEIAYEDRPARPTLASSELQWERALVEGHSTHPVSKLPKKELVQY